METKTGVSRFLETFLGESNPDLVSRLAPISDVVETSKKDILFLDGQEGSHVFFLFAGGVKLFRTNDEGKESIIHFVRPGELFAEILLSNTAHVYPVSATTIEDSTLLRISTKGFRKAIRDEPEFAIQLVGAMARRLKYFVSMVENLTLADVRTRFIHYLRNLSVRGGSRKIELPVPKGDLALLLGTTPETFSRVLRKLSDEGEIAVEGRTIEILNTALLDEAGEFRE